MVEERLFSLTINSGKLSMLKLIEYFLKTNLQVIGARKVGLHLMLGVIALFAGQLLKLIS